VHSSQPEQLVTTRTMSDLNTKAKGSAKEAAVAARAMATTKFNAMLEAEAWGKRAIEDATAESKDASKAAAEARTAADSEIRESLRKIKASESLTREEKNLRMMLINDGRIKRTANLPTDIAATIIAKIAADEAEEWAKTKIRALADAKTYAMEISDEVSRISRAADRAALEAEAACKGDIDNSDVVVDDGDGGNSKFNKIDDGNDRDDDTNDDDDDDDDGYDKYDDDNNDDDDDD